MRKTNGIARRSFFSWFLTASRSPCWQFPPRSGRGTKDKARVVSPGFASLGITTTQQLQTACREIVRQCHDYNTTLSSTDQHELSGGGTQRGLDRSNDRITNRNSADSLVAIAVKDLDHRLGRCGEHQTTRKRERVWTVVIRMEIETSIARRRSKNSLKPKSRIQ